VFSSIMLHGWARQSVDEYHVVWGNSSCWPLALSALQQGSHADMLEAGPPQSAIVSYGWFHVAADKGPPTKGTHTLHCVSLE
jgi:hypothetical protein